MLAFSVHQLITTLKPLKSGYLTLKLFQKSQKGNSGVFSGLHLTLLFAHRIFSAHGQKLDFSHSIQIFIINRIKLIPQEQLDIALSESSALSNADCRTLRRLYDKITGKNPNEDIRKLIYTFEKLHTDNILLKNENEGLHKTVKTEKDHRKCGKSLFNDLTTNDDNKAIFFSPSKIAQRRQEIEQEEQNKQQIEREEAEKKAQQALRKEEREILNAQRKTIAAEKKKLAIKKRLEKEAQKLERLAQKRRKNSFKMKLNRQKNS